MFDYRTLILGELLIPFAFMLIQLIEFGWTDKQAVKVNIGANLFQFLGYLLFFMSKWLPDFFTVGLSNIFIFISILFMLTTTYRLFDIKVPLKVFQILGISIFSIMLFFYFIDLLMVRFFIMSVGLGLICFYGVFYLLTHLQKRKRALLYIISSEFILLGIASLCRFIFFKDGPSFFKNNWESVIYIIESSLFILVWNYTIQLKRNIIIMDDIVQSNKLINKTQEDLSILNHIYYEESDTYSLKTLYEEIFDLMKSRFNIQKAVIFINDEEKFSAEYSTGFSSGDIDLLLKEKRFTVSDEFSADFVGNLDDGEYKSLLLSKGLLGGISYPLYTRGHSVGSLYIGIVSNSTIVNSDREIVLYICRQVAGIIHNAQLHNKVLESQEKLKEMASTDHLTGIYNRREFFIQFRGEFSSTMRHKDSITLFMIDLDKFKKINDTFGHDAGDLTLIAVVNKIRNQLRTNDLFARYGGEEFVGVLLRGEKEGAIKKLQKLIDDISNLIIPEYPKIKVTISIGCCHYKEEYKNVESMIKRADIALYKAKKNGISSLWVD